MQDWHRTHELDRSPAAPVDSRRRIVGCFLAFALLLAAVGVRVIQLEATQGEAFRREATKPIQRTIVLPADRGRILSRDGRILAEDRDVRVLTVHYRWLEQPAGAQWLAREARARLPHDDRRNPEKLREAEQAVLSERDSLRDDLCELCGVSREQWAEHASRIQTRVQRIAESVNRRRIEAWSKGRDAGAAGNTSTKPNTHSETHLGRLLSRLAEGSFDDEGPPKPIEVAEQQAFHPMIDGLPEDAVQEIARRFASHSGVRVECVRRRAYPEDALACHLIGHLGIAEEDAERQVPELVGLSGVEAMHEDFLRGTSGMRSEEVGHDGRVLAVLKEMSPRRGKDIVLTINAELQTAAERLLARAIAERDVRFPNADGGGACLVMDVGGGELLAAASHPRFDPNLFAGADQCGLHYGDGSHAASVLQEANQPLFNRVTRMAIPTGSVFKPCSAVAFLESSVTNAHAAIDCRGYLRSPDTYRCAQFIRDGVGHGETNLSDALCQSCNVYFFTHAEQTPAAALQAWAWQFGYGRRTGIDLPHEEPGDVPMPPIEPDVHGASNNVSPETLMLSVGQGRFRATLLQVARMTAAIANGGSLVRPHVVVGNGAKPVPIEGVQTATLEAVREGMDRVVQDPRGTAYATGHIDDLPYGGKTGTAETSPGEPAHAWFAAYVPSERPRYVVVVALEHAGDASEAACPVVRRLILQMREQGMFAEEEPRAARGKTE